MAIATTVDAILYLCAVLISGTKMAEKSKGSGFDTTCVHGGHKGEQHRAHLTPIYATSTYTFDSTEQGVAVFKGDEPGYIYSRFGNPTINEAEEKIALLEAYGLTDKDGSPLKLKAILHASGMAAREGLRPLGDVEFQPAREFHRILARDEGARRRVQPVVGAAGEEAHRRAARQHGQHSALLRR